MRTLNLILITLLAIQVNFAKSGILFPDELEKILKETIDNDNEDVELIRKASNTDSSSENLTDNSNEARNSFRDKCLEENSVVFKDDKCYPILKQGPCDKHEWIVLDFDDKDEPFGKCVEKECPDGEILFNGTCEFIRNPCERNMEIFPNPFGEGTVEPY